MNFTKRSLLMVLILCVLTSGVYSLYWVAKTQNEIKDIERYENIKNGMFVLITIIATLGVYMIFWMYQVSGQVNNLLLVNGFEASIHVIVYPIIGIVLSPAAFIALIQRKLNLLI